MLTNDNFLVPTTEEQKLNSVVFEAPMSEYKSNYTFYLFYKKSLTCNIFGYSYNFHQYILLFDRFDLMNMGL